MMLSVLSDFCTWWPFWWIVPFVLGSLLGYFTWGKYKSKVTKLEAELKEHKAIGYKYEKLLKKCEIEVKDMKSKLVQEKGKNSELQKELDTTQQQLSKSKAVPQKVITEASPPKSVSKDIVPISNSPTQSGNKKDLYGVQSSITSMLRSTNLQIIQGIGPKMEKLLNENNIKSWSDLSGKSFGEIRAILDKYGNRYIVVDPTEWSKQANLASKSKWQELIELQKELGNSSKLQRVLVRLGLA